MTPSVALEYYSADLTEYEKMEINEFSDVFYIGAKLKNKIGHKTGSLN